MNLLEKINGLSEEKKKKFIDTIKERGSEFGIYPLANNQTGMWCVYKTDIGRENPFYNAAFKIEFKDNVGHERIKSAIQQLWDTQDVFSFKYIELDGVPYQYFDKDSKPVIEEVDISDTSKDEIEKILQEKELEFTLRNFNLFEENPIKFQIVKINKDYEVLFLSVHHIISDGWSDGVICKTIMDGYAGIKQEKTSYQYANHIVSEKTERMQNKLKNNISFWKEKLSDSEHFLDLPTVYSRSSDREKRSDMVTFPLDKETTQKLKNIVKETQSNLHAVLLSLFSIVITRYANKSSMNVGTTLANRDDLRTVNLVGDFASVVIMPVKCNENSSIIDGMETVRDLMFQSMDHSNVILSDIIENVPFQRLDNVHPLYQVIFAVHSKKLLKGCAEGEMIPVNGSSAIMHTLKRNNANDYKLDMCMIIWDNGEDLELQVEYSTKLFSAERVTNIAKAFIHVIHEAVSNVNQKVFDCKLVEVEKLKERFKELQIKYTPKKLLDKVNILEENIAVINSEMALLDISKHSVPIGFEGDIYFKQNGEWYATGERAWVDENGDFSIIEYKSSVIEFNNKIIDLRESEKNLKEKFDFAFCELNYDKNKNLILYYDGNSEITKNSVIECIGIIPTIIYKTKESNSNKILNNVKNITSAVKELSLNSNVKDIAVIQQVNGEIFDIIFSTKNGEKLSEDMIQAIYKNNKSESIIFKYCKYMPNNGDNTLDNENSFEDLIVYYKEKISNTEKKITDIWRKILGDDSEFGLYDKFFEVGGSSIKIIKMLNMINKEFNMKVNIAELFDCNTISEISERLDKKYLLLDQKKNEVEILKF